VNVPAPCAEAVRQLWDQVDGGLDERAQHELDRHLAWCLRCCGEVAFLRELRRRLAVEPAPLPPDVGARLERFLEDLDPSTGPAATPAPTDDRPTTERDRP
jgi:anti-sigma factor RsiW